MPSNFLVKKNTIVKNVKKLMLFLTPQKLDWKKHFKINQQLY